MNPDRKAVVVRTLKQVRNSERLAYDRRAAARVLGISPGTLWLQVNRAKTDPRRVRRTSYGTYPRAELERHLLAELEAA